MITKYRKMRWARHLARMIEECIQNFGRKTRGMTKPRTPRNGQKSNTEVNLKNRMGIWFHKFFVLSLLTVK
jgi:hypothetical protein